MCETTYKEVTIIFRESTKSGHIFARFWKMGPSQREKIIEE